MLKNIFDSGNRSSTAALDFYLNMGLFTGIVLAACLAVYSSLNLMSITGPTSLAISENGGITISLSDRFVKLDKDGSIINEREFEKLGLQGLINDIQSLNNGDLIIGDGGSRSLYSCDSNLDSCRSLTPGLGTERYDVGKYHKFHVDENNQEIILSNTERHELALLNMDGSLKATLIPKTGSLGFPDGLAAKSQNQILLANALKKQLLHISILVNKAKEIKSYPIENEYTVEGQTLPMTLSKIAKDQWWVAAQASSLTGIGASILRFDDALNPIGRVVHESLVHPVDILDIDDFVLVADMHAYKVFAFDHKGSNPSVFGDSNFTAMLSEQKSFKELNDYLRWFAIGLLVVVLVLALIIDGIRKKEKQKKEELEKAGSTKDSLKLTISESVVRVFRLMPIMIIILLGMSGFLLFGSMQDLVLSTGGPVLLMGLFILVISYTVVKHIPNSIDISSDKISITTQKNNVLTDSIINIAYTDNTIWIKNDYYNLGAKGALLKNKAGYEKLMGLLSGAKKLSFWEHQKRIYKKDKASSISMIALFIIVSVLILTNSPQEGVNKDKEVLHTVIAS